jgi:arylsulfatase A-like enzyme
MRLITLALLLSSFCILHSPARSASRSDAGGSLAAASSSEASAKDGRPNIIVIMADDLGYGDVSCYGTTALKTPNIDQLAAEGLRFTSGYCSASTCTPTRFSFITGTYAFRQKGTGVAPPNGPALIKPGTTTIASLMKQAGYATAVIGKWHLGLGDPKPDWNGELNPGPARNRLRPLPSAAHDERPRAAGVCA